MHMKKIYIVAAIICIAGIAFISLRSPASSVSTGVGATQSTGEYHDNIYLVKENATQGSYMTDFVGMTLYTFDVDQVGKSACVGTCAQTWRPYASGAMGQQTFPTNISVITREDGSEQFAWKGAPLYYYTGDASEGDQKGDGLEGAWHIVKM